MKPAILLLMHQGRSFVEEIANIARSRGLVLIAVSSQPKHQDVYAKNLGFLDDCIQTSSEHLRLEDVEAAARHYQQDGYDLQAVLATFEAYRLFMACMNQALGVRDCAPDPLRGCLDKFMLRRKLRDLGLSEVRSLRTDGRSPVALDPSVRWFIKPVRGAGSFACFVIESPEDLQDLPRLRRQMENDREMSAIFMDQFDFTIEEYIEGPEFSFEIVAAAILPVTLCVHEKAKLSQLRRTTLENMSICPAIGLPETEIAAGARFVERCLSTLGLEAGAFHVEAKYWSERKRWEIIEINPRMGGSLIGVSVMAVTGESMLELWIDTLLCTETALPALQHRLKKVAMRRFLPSSRTAEAVVFLTMYGEKGRTVRSISFESDSRPPNVLKMHHQAGDVLEDSDRAIALMDALWHVRRIDLGEEVEHLADLAQKQFRVSYV